MIDGLVIGETERAYHLDIPLFKEDVWIGKRIIEDGIAPKWAMEQKGIDSDVKLIFNSNGETSEESRTHAHPAADTPPGFDDIAATMKRSVKAGREIVEDVLGDIEGTANSTKLALIERIAVSIFIEARKRGL